MRANTERTKVHRLVAAQHIAHSNIAQQWKKILGRVVGPGRLRAGSVDDWLGGRRGVGGGAVTLGVGLRGNVFGLRANQIAESLVWEPVGLQNSVTDQHADVSTQRHSLLLLHLFR